MKYSRGGRSFPPCYLLGAMLALLPPLLLSCSLSHLTHTHIHLPIVPFSIGITSLTDHLGMHCFGGNDR